MFPIVPAVSIFQFISRAKAGLSVVSAIIDTNNRINESERNARALREILRRIVSGNNCLEFSRTGGCITRSEFVIRGIPPQQQNVFHITINREGIDEDLTINFGLVDQGLSFGRLVITGRSAGQLKSNDATEVYAWMFSVQDRVFNNRGRVISGSQPK